MNEGLSELRLRGGAMSAIALTLGVPAFAGATACFVVATTS
jgi:hypothetical protein